MLGQNKFLMHITVLKKMMLSEEDALAGEQQLGKHELQQNLKSVQLNTDNGFPVM